MTGETARERLRATARDDIHPLEATVVALATIVAELDDRLTALEKK